MTQVHLLKRWGSRNNSEIVGLPSKASFLVHFHSTNKIFLLLPVPFLPLARQFKAVLFDSYGVLKNYAGVIEGGVEALETLRAEGIALRVLTNDASRSRGQQADKFRALGYSSMRTDEIITSGMMAKLFLQEKVNSGSVAYLGTPDAARYVLDAGCVAVPVGEVDDFNDITALVFLDDEGFDWNLDLNAAVNLLRHRNIPVVVANTDKLYPKSLGRVAVATGGLAKLVEEVVGRKFLYFGKPDTQMFNYAYEELNLNESIAKSEVLMVGDTLTTDIIGANKFGIRSCLALSGVTSAKEYIVSIERTGIMPDHTINSIGT